MSGIESGVEFLVMGIAMLPQSAAPQLDHDLDRVPSTRTVRDLSLRA